MPQTTPYAAGAPDVLVSFILTQVSSGVQAGGTPLTNPPARGTSLIIDNRQLGAVDWVVAYQVDGFSAITLRFQDAPVSSGAPGTWEDYAGTVTGTNPGVATTQAVIYGSGDPYPFLRVNLTAATGTGSVTGVLYGYRRHF